MSNPPLFPSLYTFCDGWPLGALLRPSDIDGCAGTVKELERIVPKLRAAWPSVKIIIRADSGRHWRVVDLRNSYASAQRHTVPR